MADRTVREMYFVHDLLVANKEEAHKFDDGKPYLVKRVFVGCESEDLEKSQIEFEKYQGWIFEKQQSLIEELEFEMGEC